MPVARGADEWLARCAACFFFSSRRRHTRWNCDWSSDVCSSDLEEGPPDRGALGGDLRRPRPAHRPAAETPRLEAGVGDELLGGNIGDDKIANVIAEIGRASCRERV